MQSNSSRSSGPELVVRQALWRAGFRGYRKNVRSLPGKPDIVFSRVKLCVFVHGCFWHSCPHCRRGKQVAKNRGYWIAKLQANVDRDARQRAQLEAMGFTVRVLWECEVSAGLAFFLEETQNIFANVRARSGPAAHERAG
jgi:DNA mismatch endonuclease (patch repair protein)